MVEVLISFSCLLMLKCTKNELFFIQSAKMSKFQGLESQVELASKKNLDLYAELLHFVLLNFFVHENSLLVRRICAIYQYNYTKNGKGLKIGTKEADTI